MLTCSVALRSDLRRLLTLSTFITKSNYFPHSVPSKEHGNKRKNKTHYYQPVSLSLQLDSADYGRCSSEIPAPVRIRRDPSLLIFRTEDETGFLTLKQANFPSVLSLCVISSLWFSRLEPRYINVCWCVCQWVSNSVCCVVSKSQQGAVRDHCSPVNHCGNSRRDAALTSAHTHTHAQIEACTSTNIKHIFYEILLPIQTPNTPE